MSEKQKNNKKKVNNETIITKDNCNNTENIYYYENRDSNTSETSNNEDNNFFSTNNSPILTSINNYKKMEKIPLLEKSIEKPNNINENEVISSTHNIQKNEVIENKNLSLDSLILNLKIISKIKPGCKLSVKDNNEIYIDTSYFQYFYRLFSDNSREATTNFLETLDLQITLKIEEIIQKNNNEMFLNSKENILLNLSHNLNLSLVGLNNLINTYTPDEYTISKIEMIINNFELKIRKISNILKVD